MRLKEKWSVQATAREGRSQARSSRTRDEGGGGTRASSLSERAFHSPLLLGSGLRPEQKIQLTIAF